MANASRRRNVYPESNRKPKGRKGRAEAMPVEAAEAPQKRDPVKPITYLTRKQAAYGRALETAEQVFAYGSAGTGKTFVFGCYAADMLALGAAKGGVDKIILSKPNVASGPGFGYRPGTLEEKMAEWFAEILGIIRERYNAHKGPGAFDCARKGWSPKIELVPFESMRSRSFNGALVYLDEAQNTTPREMEMFLTRVGEGSRVVVNGDIRQRDIHSESGLAVALGKIERHGIPAEVIHFTSDDIVRSGICGMWVRAFEDA